MATVSFTWSTELDPQNGLFFVIEEGGSGDAVRYGPMPGYIVESFIKARRQTIEREVKKYGNTIRIFDAPDDLM